jgi:hypothetical protein
MAKQTITIDDIEFRGRGERLMWKFVAQRLKTFSATVFEGDLAYISCKDIVALNSHFRLGKSITGAYA